METETTVRTTCAECGQTIGHDPWCIAPRAILTDLTDLAARGRNGGALTEDEYGLIVGVTALLHERLGDPAPFHDGISYEEYGLTKIRRAAAEICGEES